MFATQQYLDTVEAGRKRFRNDGDLAFAAAGFGEHRNKRLQSSLPLRHAHRASQQSLSQTIMPLNAKPVEVGARHAIDEWRPDAMYNPAHCADAEMAMTPTAQPTTSARAESTNVLGAQHYRRTGRMSILTQPRVVAQVRGQDAEWASAQTATVPNGIVNLGHHFTGFSQDTSVPRGMNANVQWHVLHNVPSLPSPISEGDDDGMNGHACAPSGMTMGHGDFVAAQSQLPAQFRCPLPCQPSPTHTMEHPNAMMDTRTHLNPAQHTESGADAASPSSGRKGHQRSKHTINSWTWQPGMKKSFSIGYRSDCDKCRLKVPGHFNHIVIS